MRTAELVMKESPTPIIEPAHTPAGIKTILFHVNNDGHRLAAQLQVALSLARSCGAHLRCLHITPAQAYVAFDSLGGVFVMNNIIESLEEHDAELRKAVELQLRKEDVSWDYEQITGSVETLLIGRAALADLLITGRSPLANDFLGSTIGLFGDLIHRSRTPLLILDAEGEQFDPCGPALVAWNGSYEAANALRSAVPLLKVASRVRLVTVEEEEATNPRSFPSTAALEYLSRHDIHAELVERPRLMDTVEQEILDQAATDRASYVVMGGYSHSRAGEFLFGGVTRALLKNCALPLLVAH